MLGNLFHKRMPDTVPEFMKRYLNSFQKQKALNQAISDVEFVVFDLETSGLSVKKDRLLSIGAVKLRDYKINIDSSLELYIKQDSTSSENVQIHGILPNSKISRLDETTALETFLAYIGSSVLVGHNATFDISMLNKSLKSLGGIKLKNIVLDTNKLYERVTGGQHVSYKPVSLDAMCDEFSIPKSDRHTASGDAYITAVLFMKLLDRLKQRGVINLSELVRDRRKLF